MSETLGPPPLPAGMRETPPNPQLLTALGRLVRGLTLLFWGLPIALVVCFQSALGDWFRPLGACSESPLPSWPLPSSGTA